MSQKTGKLTVICGCMFAGKTTKLLNMAEEYKKPLFVKPIIDTRYDKDCVITHNGIKHNALRCGNVLEILLNVTDCDVVAIDEAHMFSYNLELVIKTLLLNGIDVIVSGLDLDSSAYAFETTTNLMSVADDVIKLKAKCSCGKDATRSFRKVEEYGRFVVGGNDKYEPKCVSCFNKLVKEDF